VLWSYQFFFSVLTYGCLLPVGEQTNVDIVKRWSNEVQEAVQSKAPLVQFHALALLHQVLQWPPCVIFHMFANFILGFLVANIFVAIC